MIEKYFFCHKHKKQKMMNDQSIWHCEDRKGQKFKLIVLPCYGKPYFVKNPKGVGDKCVIRQPNTFKMMKEIVQGPVERMSRYNNVLIHPLFREERKEWDIVGEFFEEYFGLYVGEDGAVKDISKKKFHKETCVFVNAEGGCGRFTPNMATIVPGRDMRKGQCPHLWGEIGIYLYGKDRTYFKDILKTMSIEEANYEETNLYDIEERQKEEEEETEANAN